MCACHLQNKSYLFTYLLISADASHLQQWLWMNYIHSCLSFLMFSSSPVMASFTVSLKLPYQSSKYAAQSILIWKVILLSKYVVCLSVWYVRHWMTTHYRVFPNKNLSLYNSYNFTETYYDIYLLINKYMGQKLSKFEQKL